MKRCSKCKKWKDESGFGRNSSHKDGLSYQCKQCDCDYSRVYYRRNKTGVKKYYSYEECHRVVDGVKEKLCRRCKRWKAGSEFYKKRKHKDGLQWCCKECADKATNECRRRRLAAVGGVELKQRA